MAEARYPRKKGTILRSGIDPQMKRLNKVHAMRSSAKKRYIAALERVEKYWDEVYDAIDEQESQAS